MIGLAKARDLHTDARKLVARGTDPAVDAKRKKVARVATTDATFKKIAEMWHEDQLPRWSVANAKLVRNQLRNDLYPCFGSVPIVS